MTDYQLRELGDHAAAEALGDITDSALAYLSLEDLLGELLERIRGALGADTAAILLVDRERHVLLARAARGIEEEVREGVQIPLGRGFAGRVAAQARPISIEDVDHADVFNPILRQKGIRSLLGVPLVVEGRVIGVLHVGTLKRRTFGESDQRLLQAAADRAALAIDNAQLSEQRAMTEVLQRHLLPDILPLIPGFAISAKYLSSPGTGVGGDWYDVFTLPDGRVAFVIGDVAGRGIGAAAVMAEARTALRAYALERHSLADVMALLNALILGSGRRRSVSLAIFALDLETDALEAVSAGHPPALLVRPDGGRELVAAASGPPLGSKISSGYAAESVDFALGSALLLYTDGLIERRGESIDAGLARLLAADLGTAPHLSLADRAFRDLGADGGVEDDVAILTVESYALGERLHVTTEADPAHLASLRRIVARWLTQSGVEDPQRFDITLACSEAAANAIEHAYGPRDASFALDGRVTEDAVEVVVSDRGAWRPERRTDRGRGLVLMKALMDEVIIERGDPGTSVTLRATRK
ncbi:MAG TPA: SpoIIE family protein phosphatase [Solirubrobacteraceae bacterium]|jgi:anti-sigma regulatory factor (Ser/Thr protein kinase)